MKIVLRGSSKSIVLRQVGQRGLTGAGLPAGGTDGQVPVKQSDADYDIAWETPPTAPVTSVNSKTGNVVLNSSDVGADAAGSATQALADANQYTDTAVAGVDTGVMTVVPGSNITVDSTDPANPIVSAADAPQPPVTSVNDKTGAVVLDKSDVGLGNVDNTSDADKPVSTDTQAALDNKLDAISSDSTYTRVYTVNATGTIQSSSPFTPTLINGALLQRRTVDGTVDVGTPTTNLNAVNKGYVDDRIVQGSGFPNGTVTAPVGTIYVDTAVTNGASSWIKKSGAGNTGWQVLEGDTRWRNIASLVDTTVFDTGQRLFAQVRRVNNTVEVIVDVYPINNSSGGEVPIFTDLTQLTGFRMNGGTWERIALVNVGGNAMVGFSKPGDNFKLFWTQGENIRARYVATTAQAWPTTLPGTPA